MTLDRQQADLALALIAPPEEAMNAGLGSRGEELPGPAFGRDGGGVVGVL